MYREQRYNQTKWITIHVSYNIFLCNLTVLSTGVPQGSIFKRNIKKNNVNDFLAKKQINFREGTKSIDHRSTLTIYFLNILFVPDVCIRVSVFFM